MRRVLLASGVAFALSSPADAQQDFFKDKQIRVIVSSETGGGYDNYGRIFARYIAKHISGTPTVIVQNMPGGGGLTATNYLYNVAPKDGTVLAQIQRNVPFVGIMGQPGALFDVTKFNWIGSLNNEVNVCLASNTTKIKVFDDVLKNQLIVGGSGPNDTEMTPAVLNNVLGAKFKIISGYPSSTQVTLAVERGEVEGLCSSYSSIVSRNYEWIRDKKVTFLVQNSAKKHPDLPNVPLSAELAKNSEDRQLLELNDARMVIGRPFVAPPGIPADRVKILRTAFEAMVKDKDFMAEADKLKMEITPVGGDEVQELLVRVAGTPKAVIDRLNDAQVYKGEKISAKAEESAGANGTLSAIQDDGRKLVFGLKDGKTLTAAISGSRTKLMVAGKAGKREDLKIGMACTVASPGDGQEASSIDCK